ncbi:MAG: a-factor receptor [Lichina confinis]|nr:MAG: a-factor receptor [Lichina confinis]
MGFGFDYRRSAGAIALPILAIFSIVLVVPPGIWHVKNRNVGACSLLFWITLANLFVFMNALIWPTDNIGSWWRGYGLCDVQVKLTWGFAAGSAGSIACIMRNLARVMDVDRAVVRTTQAQRRRQTIVDLLWCFGCPIYVMSVDYIVQTYRYYIFTVAGCTPAIDSSWLAIVLVIIWGPIFCLLAAFYCVLVIIRLHKYRKQFLQILSASSANLNKSRFMRLFFMSLMLLLVLLPVQFYVLAVNLSYPHRPYSWKAVHSPDWGRVIMIPTGGQVAFDRWIRVSCGFLVFVFFGTGNEAISMYRKWLLALGLGRWFPSLAQSRRRPGYSKSTASKSRWSSLGGRAKELFSRAGSQTATTVKSLNRASSDGTATSPSPSDPEKAFERVPPVTEMEMQTASTSHNHPRALEPLDLGTSFHEEEHAFPLGPVSRNGDDARV